MDVCREKAVPFFRTDDGRSVACFRYADKPTMQRQEIPAMISQLALRNQTESVKEA
jgi:hypothetical protein